MILAVTRMKVISEKRMELSQTIAYISGFIRQQQGCRRCELCQSIDDEDRLYLLEEWDSEENMMTHLNSEHFRVLRGAMNLLQEPYERNHFTMRKRNEGGMP